MAMKRDLDSDDSHIGKLCSITYSWGEQGQPTGVQVCNFIGDDWKVGNKISGSISCWSDKQGRIMSSGSNAVESGSNQAGCLVKAMHDIISGFDERKKKIVESMGFIRLLKFPPNKSTNSAGKL